MEQTDGAAVALAQTGDSDAFQTLVERHSRAVFKLAFRMTSNEQDAEDVVQETFLRAYRQLHRFENRSSFSTWLHRIAANCAFDLMRLRQRHDTGRESIDTVAADGPQPLTASDPAPDRVLLSAEMRQTMDRVLALMSPKEKVAFVLRHFEGLSIEEISRTMGVQSNAARNNICRAVKKIRKALEPMVSLAK